MSSRRPASRIGSAADQDLATGRAAIHGRTPGTAGPSPEEMAAIVAAIEMAWPRPVVVEPEPDPLPVWRFSGRWWLPRRPVAASRRRP